jgi:hypothetical protein
VKLEVENASGFTRLLWSNFIVAMFSTALSRLHNTMKRRVAFFTLCLSVCLVLFYACAADKPIWQAFPGIPGFGLHTYAAELHSSDTRNGTKLNTGALFVARNAVRYEMQGTGPLEQMILLARLDSGQAWLVNPAGNKCLEGNFAPRRWADIGYLLEAFPKVMPPRIISSNEETLGKELLSGHKVSKIRRTGREVVFGEERDFTEFFWLAEESCIPLRHERGMVISEVTNIRQQALDASLFAFPSECRKVSSFAELLQ